MDELADAPVDAAVAGVPPRGRRARAGGAVRRRRGRPGQPPLALVAAVIGGLLYIAFAPPTADLAAASFRADLFAREGFTLYSTAWYGGHHTPGYSVLYPPLAALLGVRLLAALSVVAATAAMSWLGGRTAALCALPALLAGIVSGRGPFTLGAALGIAAVAAAVRRGPGLAAILAVLTAFASPVAALFVALAGAALIATPLRPAGEEELAGRLPALRSRPGAAAGLALIAGAAVPTAFLVALFPEGGTFPFVVSAFLPCVVAAAAVAIASPPGPVRTGAVLYGVLCVAAFVVPSPIGGNAVRLGALAIAPIAVALLWPRRKVLLAVLALPLAYWILQPAARDALRTIGDPATEASFYRPLTDFLKDRPPGRVEIPFTQNHWETRYVADDLPIARGWERQVDRDRNGLFYEGTLTPARYERWLRENAIAYVALPLGIPRDASGEAEARLVAKGLPFLEEIDTPGRWRVFAVRNAAPAADGAARLISFTPTGAELRFDRPGRSVVKLRWTPFWRDGSACVREAPGGWTEVTSAAAGTVRLSASHPLGLVRNAEAVCTPG